MLYSSLWSFIQTDKIVLASHVNCCCICQALCSLPYLLACDASKQIVVSLSWGMAFPLTLTTAALVHLPGVWLPSLPGCGRAWQ